MTEVETSANGDPLDKLVNSIRIKVEKPSPPSDCCIFTIPERLRKSNEEAYKPRVVAIGPYHRGDPRLEPMEDHKLWYVQNFFHFSHDRMCHLEDYIMKVKSLENEARECYDKHIDLPPDDFAEMMLLDGIFVIQLFLMHSQCQQWLPRDRIFSKPWMLTDVRRDMALLENQIPFFIVQQLFEMAFGTHQETMPGLLELTYGFFELKWAMELEVKRFIQVKHFVDAISLSFLPLARKVPNESNEKTKFTPSFTPSATELDAAGVKLIKCESTCLYDIEFKNGVLNIPCLTLDDWTESYFRNITAFEQCYCENRYLTDYMDFMHHLVDTPGDAELLINRKIIENWLSNKEAVARVINAFGEENELSSDYYFQSLNKELNDHCDKLYNKWKATFKRDYCSSPWVAISVIAAVVLLLLTVAQTVLSALSLK